MKNPREAGFYWVHVFGAWDVAEWGNHGPDLWLWQLTGTDQFYTDDELDEIDERRLTRQA